PADAAPIRPAARVRAQRGQAADAPDAPAGGVGARLRGRLESPTGERVAAPAQARARPRPASLRAHRAGRRLPAGRADPARVALSGFLQASRLNPQAVFIESARLWIADARPRGHRDRRRLLRLRLRPALGA